MEKIESVATAISVLTIADQRVRVDGDLVNFNDTFLRAQTGDLSLAEEIVDRSALPETAEARRIATS